MLTFVIVIYRIFLVKLFCTTWPAAPIALPAQLYHCRVALSSTQVARQHTFSSTRQPMSPTLISRLRDRRAGHVESVTWPTTAWPDVTSAADASDVLRVIIRLNDLSQANMSSLCPEHSHARVDRSTCTTPSQSSLSAFYAFRSTMGGIIIIVIIMQRLTRHMSVIRITNRRRIKQRCDPSISLFVRPMPQVQTVHFRGHGYHRTLYM